jgi:hypothetical protein
MKRKSGVTFPNRRTGLIHVWGVLQLEGRPVVGISFRREDLARLMRLAPQSPHLDRIPVSVFTSLVRTWGTYRMGAPLPAALRRRVLTIRDTYEGDDETGQPNMLYRVTVSRQDLALIARDWARALTEFRLLFMGPVWRPIGGRRPRGARAIAPLMLPPVRWALLEAERLCTIAQADSSVRDRVHRVLGDDFDPRGWKQNAVALVSRTFRGAWAKYDVKPPEARTEGDAGDVYRQLVPAAYRRKILAVFKDAQQDAAAGVPEAEVIHERWTERLLGPEGQAARDFDLI